MMIMTGDDIQIQKVIVNYYSTGSYYEFDIKPIFYRIFTGTWTAFGCTNGITIEKEDGYFNLYLEFDGMIVECFELSEIKQFTVHKMTKDDVKQYRRELNEFFE